MVERDLKNCNGCICPKRPNYLHLHRNLDDKITSKTLITFTLRKLLKQSKPEVKPMLVKFTSQPLDLRICVITTLKIYLACTGCKHGDNKALFFHSVSF